MTPDEEDYALLMLANDKGKFAVALGQRPDEGQQAAFERGIDGGWFTFADLSPLAEYPSGGLFKIFRMTEAGWQRLHALRKSLGKLS